MSSIEKINRELSRLEDEESSAENLLLERQRQLRKKGVEMLKKGLDDMEELEEEERKEAEEKVVVDFSGFSFDPSMEDLFGGIAQGGITDPSSSGGTGGLNVGTSSGA
uniref:Uncharacterized protein n=1 Tax=Bionectria ochroleuca TaxID=29856 RepID=A0A8H7N780_BIOOC